MNVLILTPDRVGSTLLQRLITVYMTAHEFNKPVINLHELTNGLMKYYSPTFNQEVLGKPAPGTPWGYHQSLDEITELLNSVDHYKTSRLAHYHIKNRRDSIEQQVPFYNYLNDNFFIISAQRDNLFEHALSWGIHTHSKKLNVYSRAEKIDTFADLYKNRITIHPEVLIKYLNQYVEYLAWVDNHFVVSSYFKYDHDLARIEDYILNLDIFSGQPKKKTWEDIFKIDFNSWNKCHYLSSDLSGIGSQLPVEHTKLTYNGAISDQRYELVTTDQSKGYNSLSLSDQQFLAKLIKPYQDSRTAIDELVQHKVLVTPVPIKLQTMLEKKLLIKNFDECIKVYNEWVDKNNIGTKYSVEEVNSIANQEIINWHAQNLLTN